MSLRMEAERKTLLTVLMSSPDLITLYTKRLRGWSRDVVQTKTCVMRFPIQTSWPQDLDIRFIRHTPVRLTRFINEKERDRPMRSLVYISKLLSQRPGDYSNSRSRTHRPTSSKMRAGYWPQSPSTTLRIPAHLCFCAIHADIRSRRARLVLLR